MKSPTLDKFADNKISLHPPDWHVIENSNRPESRASRPELGESFAKLFCSSNLAKIDGSLPLIAWYSVLGYVRECESQTFFTYRDLSDEPDLTVDCAQLISVTNLFNLSTSFRHCVSQSSCESIHVDL